MYAHRTSSRFSGISGISELEFSNTQIVGFFFLMHISGSILENSKFLKPELPDAKFSNYPNTQSYLMVRRVEVEGRRTKARFGRMQQRRPLEAKGRAQKPIYEACFSQHQNRIFCFRNRTRHQKMEATLYVFSLKKKRTLHVFYLRRPQRRKLIGVSIY